MSEVLPEVQDSAAESEAAPAPLPLFATCPKGVEPLLLEELRQLGAASVKETVGEA